MGDDVRTSSGPVTLGRSDQRGTAGAPMVLARIDVQHDQRLRGQPFALGLSTGGLQPGELILDRHHSRDVRNGMSNLEG
jgi:hypothetical protein